MTEQERDKRIKGMEDTISEFREQNLCDHFSHTECALHCDECHLGVLVDAGYRKADEVRKETVKKIIDFLKENGHFGYDYPSSPHSPIVTFDPCIFEDIENEFGVEEL